MRIQSWLPVILLLAAGCNTKTGQTANGSDSTRIAAGSAIFKQDCAACHSMDRDAIGPRLGGITSEVSDEWLAGFIANPEATINSGDERARKAYERYKTMMPSFAHYSTTKLEEVVAFLKANQHIVAVATAEDPNGLKDPIPSRVPASDLVLELKEFLQMPFSSEEMPRTRTIKMEIQPGTRRVFMVDLRGKMYDVSNGIIKPYFDISERESNFIHQPGLATGFGSVAFHPDFISNGLMYTSHTEPPRTKLADFRYNDTIPVVLQWVLKEWKTADPKGETFAGEGRELLRIDMVSQIHGMQELSFNPTAMRKDPDYGLLYIGIGDGGCVEHGFPFLLRNRKDLWGSVIRIDPSGKNSANGQYGIPKTNPLSGGPGGEIYADGFRNPHHITWLQSGLMLVSNIGQRHIESYTIIEAGDDCGWPIREGSFVHHADDYVNSVYPLTENDKALVIKYPVIEYDHDEGNAISDGFEYTGKAVPGLRGKFLYADIMTGRLFYSDVAEIKPDRQALINECFVSLDGKQRELKELCGTSRVDVRVARDADGELYLFTKPDGKVYKITGVHHRSGKALSSL